MSAIEVQNQSGVLVVDSRLIAQDLGIEHRSLLQLIDDYQTQVEQAFGILRFENAEIEGRGRPARFAFLTEDQATFVMTLSRNTDAVVKAKLSLVRSFSAAKAALQGQAPQPQPIAPPTDPFWQLIDGAIARNMQPEQVISLKRLYDGTPAPTPAAPKAAKVKPEPLPKPLPPLTAEIEAVISSGEPVAICDVLTRIGYNPNSKVNQMQAADSLKILGWKSARRTFNGKVGRVWEHK